MSVIFKPVFKPVFKPLVDPTLVGSIQKTLSTALAWFDPTTIVGANPVTEWQNRGVGLSGYDLDVVVGTDANLITLESGVGLLTGTSGDFFSVIDQANPTNLDIYAWIAPNDWAATISVFGHYLSTGNQKSFLCQISATGLMKLFTSSDGLIDVISVSTAATGFTDGTGHWLRWTWTPAGDLSNFFMSNDPRNIDSDDITWTPLGDPNITHIDSALHNSTAVFEVGSFNTGVGDVLAGKVARVILHDDVGGNPLIDIDTSLAAVNVSTFLAKTGQTVTVNGDAFVNATSFPALLSRGSVVLEATAGQSITGTGITVYAVFKPTLAAPGADQFIFDARSNAAASASLRSDESNADKYTLNQGSDIALTQAYDNDLQVYTAQFLGTASTKLTADAGSVTGDAGSENWDFGTIFGALGGGSTTPGAFYELQIYDTAHTTGQITLMKNHLGAKYA